MELKDIQVRLRECIAESGIPQKEIAKRVGVSLQTISKYMKKDIFPALDTFARLCSVLDVTSDFILGLKGYRGVRRFAAVRGGRRFCPFPLYPPFPPGRGDKQKACFLFLFGRWDRSRKLRSSSRREGGTKQKFFCGKGKREKKRFLARFGCICPVRNGRGERYFLPPLILVLRGDARQGRGDGASPTVTGG